MNVNANANANVNMNMNVNVNVVTRCNTVCCLPPKSRVFDVPAAVDRSGERDLVNNLRRLGVWDVE